MFKAKILLSSSSISKITWCAILAAISVERSVLSEVSQPTVFDRPKKTLVVQEDRELALARQVHQQINEYRRSLNLAPLKLNAQISEQARMHSENMAQKTVKFSHQGFNSRVKALNISYRSAAENVAYNQGDGEPVEEAVAGWIDSESHRQNLTGNFNLTGIGVAKNQQEEYYFTQIFILEN